MENTISHVRHYTNTAAGEYTFAMFSVIGLALIVSWFAAIFVTPLAGYHLLKADAGQAHDLFHTPFYNRLRSLIDWCLHYRKTVLAGTLIALHGTVEATREPWACELDERIWQHLRASTQRRAMATSPF